MAAWACTTPSHYNGLAILWEVLTAYFSLFLHTFNISSTVLYSIHELASCITQKTHSQNPPGSVPWLLLPIVSMLLPRTHLP